MKTPIIMLAIVLIASASAAPHAEHVDGGFLTDTRNGPSKRLCTSTDGIVFTCKPLHASDNENPGALTKRACQMWYRCVW